ncbi:MAG: hypothetical protein IJT76_04595 [Clostridia bacterium]|nr:hypothetical protein [Clostridia bacterium]
MSFLDEEFGVSLGKKQVEEFTELFVELNNRSHLWLNGGWSPNDLSRSFGRRPENISIGPNLKKLFESGEMDRTKFEKRLKELGIKLSD